MTYFIHNINSFYHYVNKILTNIQKLHYGVSAPLAKHANVVYTVAGLMFVDDLHIKSINNLYELNAALMKSFT